MRSLINIKEVSKALSLSRATLYRLMEQEQLPHIRIGGRLLFDPEEIEGFIDEHRVEAAAVSPPARA